MKNNFKVEKQNGKSKFMRFIESPGKLNTIAILLIVIAYLIVAGVVIGIVGNYKNYTIYPDYEEMQCSEELNTFVKIYTNYSYSDDELITKDYVILQCYADKNDSVSGLKGRISTKHENGKMIYHTDKVPTVDIISTNTVYVTNAVTFESKVEEIFGEFSYNYIKESETLSKEYTFKEAVINLTKDDLKRNEVNELTSATYKYKNGEEERDQKLFGSFSVSATKDEANDVNNVSLRLSTSSVLKGKYHLDIQMFAVSGKEVYPLVGYYNLSNSIVTSYSQTAKLPLDLEVDYVYAKAKYVVYYTDGDNNITDKAEYELLFKQSFSTLFK